MRFNRKDYEKAIAAFQNGVQETTEFPAMPPAFTQMLFDSFSATVDRGTDGRNNGHMVVTAKLADQLGLSDKSKFYWTHVKSNSTKGTPEYRLASERLRHLNLVRYLINIGIIAVLLVVLLSGCYTLHRHRRKRRKG